MILLSSMTPDDLTTIHLQEGSKDYTITIKDNIYQNSTSGLVDIFYSVHYNGETNPVIESWLGELEQEANSDEPNIPRKITECILSQYGQMDRNDLDRQDIIVNITPLNDGYWIIWEGVSMSIDMETHTLSHCAPLNDTPHTIQAIRIGKTIENLLKVIYPYDFEDVLQHFFNQNFECSLATMFHYESLKKDVDIVIDIDQLHQLRALQEVKYHEQPLYV